MGKRGEHVKTQNIFAVGFLTFGILISKNAASAISAERSTVLERIIQSLSDRPDMADDTYLTDGTVRSLLQSNLEKCSYDLGEMETIDKIIDVFWDSKKGMRSYKEIEAGLFRMTELNVTQRDQIRMGAWLDASTTLGALKANSCRAYLRWQIELGATRAELLGFVNSLRPPIPRPRSR